MWVMAKFQRESFSPAPPPGQATEAGGPFTKVDGRESLLRAVELFLNRDNIHHVQLVFTPDMLEEGKRKYGGHLSFSGVKVLSAGPRWSDQIFAATGEKFPPRQRPTLCCTMRLGRRFWYADIEAVLAAAEKNPAVTPGDTGARNVAGNGRRRQSDRGFASAAIHADPDATGF